MDIKCIYCAKHFHVKPSRIKKNPIYCSMECRKNHAKTQECFNCSKRFTNKKSGNNDRKYCSHPCYLQHKKQIFGVNHHKWTTGITAYRRIAKHLKLQGCKLCLTHLNLEIHHINENREDNSIDNLVCLCRKCHKLTHWGKTYFSQFLKKIIS